MVLPLKRRKSRTSPGFVAGACARIVQKNPFALLLFRHIRGEKRANKARRPFGLADLRSGFRMVVLVDAGWSSPVARQAHNLKVVGSNPTPATRPHPRRPWLAQRRNGAVIVPLVSPRQAHSLKVRLDGYRRQSSHLRQVQILSPQPLRFQLF
jgi:hypothetical protein